MEKDKTRRCYFCSKEIEVDCWYYDYCLCKCDGTGKTYIDFDACEDCLKDIVQMIRDNFKNP